ncbi:gamma-tubulin complex, DGRIP84/SPC97 component [Gloeophyllum trabeum ATCC 11539]|uniref:Spindle pole body component n=1 Tax=Gloeophyllum trabeum (strain ATCC 11539 / FP-39264 / Madison 617) TaxID=670483 RepID=S7RBH9_GLOTA|nr:gamma-tubulin complex, DGRIP84/SPC97 component [Gloeophyllum trabeum ATCC 11539]EPQ51590.1 gamma-tubulin complex, DGRIP84/SPC97 component [Gloeophyllum trabeum ATCC 11539]
MEPYTPRTHNGSRKKLTLSTKEYNKITGTLASARRSRHYREEDEELDGHSYEEPSFIAETSFVRAPLNSRVVSNGSVPLASFKGKAKQESLERIPLDVQEALILEDLLYVLMGIEGVYIRHHPDYSPEDDDPLQGIRFVVSPSLDPSLRDLVERIIPLATYYTAISSFIELRSDLDFGMVNHALCAALRDMLKDYQTLLSQLEHAFNTSLQFSLQKLWFYIHPTVHTLYLLHQLVTELASADDASMSLPSSASVSDIEDNERDEALGLGGAHLKAAMSQMKKNALGVSVDSGNNIAVKGGEVLTIVYEKAQTMSGDPAAKKLYSTLLRAAGKPYVTMLQTWITTGRLLDPYEELCVKESKFINRGTLEMDYVDEYWERRYTLRDGSTVSGPSKRQAGIPSVRPQSGRLPGGACIPPLLEPLKHKILLAGKYLNVIRECGIEIKSHLQESEEGELLMDDERFYKFIEEAYTHANRTLLQLLLKDQQLVPRLRSLKRCFFLSQSSFLTHFLDLSQSELRKYVKAASVVKLQSLLDMTLSTDMHGDDAMFREDVRVTLASSKLYDWLMKVVNVSGVIGGSEDGQKTPSESAGHDESKKRLWAIIDALAFDYNVKFPLSLVISRKTILRYQLLFRFLLHCKHVEQCLTTMWIEQKGVVWRKSVPHHHDFEMWRLRVHLLRSRMLAFVQQIMGFATAEVLEPNWRDLEMKLTKVSTVDQLLRDHVDFLDTCLKECMLTSSKLLRPFSKLMTTCTTFALYTHSFSKSASQSLAAAESQFGDQAMAKRWDFLGKFETNFNHWFSVHLDHVQFAASSENASLIPLVMRLSSIKAQS